MTTIIDDLTARLEDLTTLLRPEERETPSEGRQANQRGGLVAYLEAHPGGVIQLEDPQPITSDDLIDTFWVPVGSMGSTPEVAANLAKRIRTALCGVSGREPGEYTLAIPDQPRQIIPGAWLVRPTFAIDLLTGQLPVQE